ncbi:MAG: prepilin-type N-terminal cleavage/methylation domain-containing protein [Rhodocyclaceae bacterium]|nr:prepilin-type N-terminal cleavage/methylation domain-containing protein [Rhodocyclaceae bacterium]MDZ4215218.1 prepilin-type N-terminal cleavage/methylation domain-containing protein [Rhodocyclaceae bacterium]
MCIKGHQQGMTLIEVIVFIVIVGVGLAGVLASLNLSVRHSADPLQPKQALVIAESVLSQVLAKSYANPAGGYVAACPATCDVSQFDDVGDFHNYTTSPLAGYSATVTINPGVALAGVNTIQVVVNVSTPASSPITLAGYRTSY